MVFKKLVDRLLAGSSGRGYHESRRCSRDTFPESCFTKYTSRRRKILTDLLVRANFRRYFRTIFWMREGCTSNSSRSVHRTHPYTPSFFLSLSPALFVLSPLSPSASLSLPPPLSAAHNFRRITGYDPFALHTPMYGAIYGYVIKKRS